jgi:hypothetical protein
MPLSELARKPQWPPRRSGKFVLVCLKIATLAAAALVPNTWRFLQSQFASCRTIPTAPWTPHAKAFRLPLLRQACAEPWNGISIIRFGRERVRSEAIEADAIEAVKIIAPEICCGSRGDFHETYNGKQLSEHAILQFVQDNQSLSLHAATIRGLHFQSFPAAQSKSFGC